MRWIYVALWMVAVQGSSIAQDLLFQGKTKRRVGSANVVVWLTPAIASESAPPPARLVQKDKKFSPHIIAVRVGSEIEFPNQDPFFHDAESIALAWVIGPSLSEDSTPFASFSGGCF